MGTKNTGWLNFSTFSNDTAVGTVAWEPPASAAAEDGSTAYTNANLNPASISNYLKCLELAGLPIDLQTNTVIVGVEVRIKRKGTTAASGNDSVVKLVKGGTISGSNYAVATIYPTSLDFSATYGGVSDLWGLTLTGGDVIAGNFGVVLSAKAAADVNPAVNLVYVDVIQMRVTYQPSGILLAF